MKDISVKDVITSDLITIHPNDSLAKVAQVLNSESIHHVPVVDDEGCLVGIISLTDFERIKYGSTLFRNPKIEEYNQALFQSLRASDVMIKDVVVLKPSDSIIEVYNILKQNKFRALPIVEKGQLAGIVTPLDLLNYFFQKDLISHG